MSNIAKAYAISDARISFVSLVDKAANKKEFLITKADGDSAKFTSYGRIIKADSDSHFVTGVVYEPLTEDSQGNYMTEAEITKAAYWFAKNSNSVDLQHCFVNCDSTSVVESFVAKSDMEIEGEAIKKGTWLMTVEISDDNIWDAVQKGDITGFSMGGVGVYSEEDVDLEAIEKSEEPKGLLKKLAKTFGFEVIEKGAVKDNFNRRIKEDNFYAAWYSLRSALEGNYYDSEIGQWVWGYSSDETQIKECLSDFNDIVTQLLTQESILGSLEKAAKEAPQDVMKSGKSLSLKNQNTLKGIHEELGTFLKDFDENLEVEKFEKKEEDEDMKQEDIQKMVGEEVAKAMDPIKMQLETIAKGGVEESAPADNPEWSSKVTAESVAKMVGVEVAKAMEPVTKAMEPLMKSRALPGNLNDSTGNVTKSGETHYMTGMF